MNEDRILDKLDSLDDKATAVLVEVAKLQEQIKDMPDLKVRVAALEKWRWTAMGAMAASTAALGSQLFGALKGVA